MVVLYHHGLSATAVLCHRYAVLYGMLRYRGLTPMVVLYHRDAVLIAASYATRWSLASGYEYITLRAVVACFCFKLLAKIVNCSLLIVN